jgi:putative Mg2+ transporter-C (MgtC) family protein
MNSPPGLQDFILRIAAATVAGTLVGLERETHGRAAGLRTTILACIASAIAMITSEYLFVASAGGSAAGTWRPDPARLGAGILTGIGFLGAGTIIRHENMIRGVTTAASLWFVTVLGLAFGSGLFVLGSIGTAFALLTLVVLPLLEKHLPSDWYSKFTVVTTLDGLTETELATRLKALGLQVQRMELAYDLANRRKTIACDLKLRRSSALEISGKAIAEFRNCAGVLEVKWV